MIFDSFDHRATYRSLGPRLAAGLDWLASIQLDASDGRYEIQGDDVFALVQSYDTVPPENKQFESHRAYLDIQFVANGAETIYYAPVKDLSPITAYDSQKDFLLYAEPATATGLHLGPSSFAIFFPHDGHKPGCLDGASCLMRKVVVKVRF